MKVEHNPGQNALEITYKIFADDLQDHIIRRYGIDPRFLSEERHPAADSLVQQYLIDHVYFEVNGKQPRSFFVGYRVDLSTLEVVALEEVPGIRRLKSFFAENAVLMEHFSDQANYLNVRYGGQARAVKLTALEKSVTLDF